MTFSLFLSLSPILPVAPSVSRYKILPVPSSLLPQLSLPLCSPRSCAGILLFNINPVKSPGVDPEFTC